MAEGNVTENNRSNRSLLELRDELQIILDSVPAWIFYKDKENRFLRVNKAFCDGMEMPKEELEGRSLFDLYPKEEAEAYWKDDKEVMASGKPKRGIREPLQHKTRGKLWVTTDKIPYRDAQGNIVGIIGFTLDVTTIKDAEDELQAAYAEEKRLRQEHQQLAEQLRAALGRIRTLDAILPICLTCKKIRDQDGRWHYMESYISSRTDAHFSHGFCPECTKKYMKENGLKQDRAEPPAAGDA